MRSDALRILGVVGVSSLSALMAVSTAFAAASTYQSKGTLENPRNKFETCRLIKTERDDVSTMCIYRRQSGGNNVVISNEDPNVSCQRSFQCKREQ